MSSGIYTYKKQREICKDTLRDMDWVGEITPADNPGHPDRTINYCRISQLLFTRFKETHLTPPKRIVSTSVVGHGFAVIGNGIGRCDEAYLRFCELNQQAATGAELSEALRSPKTVRLFTYLASMSNDKNLEYEQWLGLRATRSAPNEFVYNALEGYFEPNSHILRIAEEEATAKALRNGENPSLTDTVPDICPARSFIPQVWEAVVTGCEQAGLFDFTIEPISE